MVVGTLPSIFAIDDLMFLLAWTYEHLAVEHAGRGHGRAAEEASALARAGFRDVFAERLGVTLKGDTDMRWLPWRNDPEQWVSRGKAYLASGDDLLACAAFAEVLALRKKEEAGGVSFDWAAPGETALWLLASRCAVRTGA